MPYDPSDARSTLPTLASRIAPGTAFSPAEYVRFAEEEPQVEDAARRTWYARGQNFVLEFTELDGEVTLERRDQRDEYVVMLLDADMSGFAQWAGDVVEVSGRSLVVMPPGDSSIGVRGTGRIVRLLSHRADDLTERAINAASYEEPHLNIAPWEPWPEPVGGYGVRVYDLSVPTLQNPKFRLFRCSTFMVNFFDPSDGPRDTDKLSPHSHEDFEQCSLVLEGEYIHHIRWPWLTRLSAWREDEHQLCGAPSVTVIPAQAIHTSQSVAPGRNQLIDIFAPPRADFSAKEGWVLNAADYPTP